MCSELREECSELGEVCSELREGCSELGEVFPHPNYSSLMIETTFSWGFGVGFIEKSKKIAVRA